MGEGLQSRLDKLGQMRVLDMHAHLAFLTGSETEKWEQKEKMAAYEAGKGSWISGIKMGSRPA